MTLICPNRLKNAKKDWTENELNSLRLYYDPSKTTVAFVANMLGRSELATRKKAYELGIKKFTIVRRTWTEEEDEELTELYGKVPIQELVKRFNRDSDHAIYQRASILGLKYRYHHGWYTCKEVSEILGVDDQTVRRAIERGNLLATIRKGELSYHNRYIIGEKDLRKYLIKYRCEIYGKNVDFATIVSILVGDEQI